MRSFRFDTWAVAVWVVSSAIACADRTIDKPPDSGKPTTIAPVPDAGAAGPARALDTAGSGGADAPRAGAGGSPARDAGNSSEASGGMTGAAGAGGSSAAGTGGVGAPAFCSGCAQETPNKLDMSIHLHHVHLNVSSREASTTFYERYLAAEHVRLNDATDALHAAPVLLLLDESKETPKSNLPTALQHVGWGSKDVAAWYANAHAQGVAPDTRANTLFNTDDTPTIGGPGSGATFVQLLGGEPAPCAVPYDSFDYMYVLGPDKERIEVWSGADLTVNHVHFTTADIATTANWYIQFFGLSATPNLSFFLFNLDDIVMFFEPIGAPADYQPTDDHVLSHVAFSVTDLDAWLERATDQKIEVVAQPAEVNGFKSFFVRGPDAMLIELVQAAPLKELCLGN